MYRLKLKNEVFTIPKENLRLLALTKAIDTGYNQPIKDTTDAIRFLEAIGVEVLE